MKQCLAKTEKTKPCGFDDFGTELMAMFDHNRGNHQSLGRRGAAAMTRWNHRFFFRGKENLEPFCAKFRENCDPVVTAYSNAESAAWVKKFSDSALDTWTTIRGTETFANCRLLASQFAE